MAEIKVNIKGDDSDVKAKFADAASSARIFKESVEKSLEAVNAASKTLISETGLGGIAKLFGAAGLVGAAEEFTKRLVGGFKDAIGAALEFQGQVGKLRSALGVAFGGQAETLANWVESVSTAFGGLEKNLPIFEALLRGGMVPEEAKKALIDIQNAAKATGSDVEELGTAFAEMKERGEVPERFWKQFPQLAPIARGLGMPEQPTAGWMLGTLLPGIAPGGLEAPGRLRAQQSIGGQIAANQEEFNKLWRELGQDLLPMVNESLKGLKSEIPEIQNLFHQLSEELKIIVPNIVKWLPFLFGGKAPEHPFGEPLKPLHDYLEGVQDNIIKLFSEPAQFLKEAAAEQKASAEELRRKLNPQ